MNKKHLFAAVLLSLMGTITAFAQSNYICLTTKTGEQIKFTLDEKPKFSYGAKTVTWTTSTTSLEYNMVDIDKVTMGETPTDVIELAESPVSDGTISGKGGNISLSGFKAGSAVTVVNAAGQLVGSYKISQDGSLDINTESYPQGVYIFKTNTLTYKFKK